MRRQIRLISAIGLTIVGLVLGLGGGTVLGGMYGYAFGSRSHPTTTSTTPASTSTTVTGQQSSTGATASYDQVVARVNPAVVTIQSTQNGATGATSIGSGIIYDDQGHIVTNNHVIEGADTLQVIYSDGHQVPASLVGADPYQDVAVIKVDPPVPATATFGDSSQLQPGQRVIAIGSALGEFQNTVTDGVVSASDRSLDTGEGYRLENLVQHDAPINPGNSGGPLIDLNGTVVGMNTAVVRGGYGQPASEGLGFAIASNTIKTYADQLIASGRIDRPYLGVSFRVLTPAGSPSAAQPVLIVDVAADGPAAAAGLHPGDIVTAVDGTALDSDHPFLNLVFAHKPGDRMTLTVRDQSTGEDRTVDVTSAQRPAGN